MKKEHNMICVIKLFKYYPLIFNIEVLSVLTLYVNKIYISNWIYGITGASIYTIILCFIASFIFKFCNWYRILCISSLLALILEWIDMNLIKINYYLCIVQIILIAGMILALISYLYGKRIDKRNNKQPEKAN